MKMWYAFTISLIIHIAPILILRGLGGGGDSKVEGEDVNFSPRKTIKVNIINQLPKNSTKKPQIVVKEVTKVPEPNECKDYYFGLGYTRMSYGDWCRVTDVSPNSPADRAGLRIDSLVLATEDGECPGRGPDGTKVEVSFSKTEIDPVATVILTREKICTEK